MIDKHDFTNQIWARVALVTGASSGIGKSFAKVLASMGLNLVVIARRVERLDQLAAQLKKEYGVEIKVCRIDLSEATAAKQVLDATASLDVGLVVSNAGFGLKGDHAKNDPKAMTDMLMVNCNTPMMLAHGFIPRLRKRGKGGIIFTSSVERHDGVPIFHVLFLQQAAFVNSLGEGLLG